MHSPPRTSNPTSVRAQELTSKMEDLQKRERQLSEALDNSTTKVDEATAELEDRKRQVCVVGVSQLFVSYT